MGFMIEVQILLYDLRFYTAQSSHIKYSSRRLNFQSVFILFLDLVSSHSPFLSVPSLTRLHLLETMVTYMESSTVWGLNKRIKQSITISLSLYSAVLNPGIPVASLNASPRHRNISKKKPPFLPHPGTAQPPNSPLLHIRQSGKQVSKLVISVKCAHFSDTNWI